MFQCIDCFASTSVRRFLAIESIIFSGSGSPPNSSMLYDPNILQGGREGGRSYGSCKQLNGEFLVCMVCVIIPGMWS